MLEDAEQTPLLPPPILRDLPDEIVGQRIVLRPYRAGDGAALWEAVEESREHIRPWLPWGDTHRTPDDSEGFARRFQAKWLLREDMIASVWERASGRFIGRRRAAPGKLGRAIL